MEDAHFGKGSRFGAGSIYGASIEGGKSRKKGEQNRKNDGLVDWVESAMKSKPIIEKPGEHGRFSDAESYFKHAPPPTDDGMPEPRGKKLGLKSERAGNAENKKPIIETPGEHGRFSDAGSYFKQAPEFLSRDPVPSKKSRHKENFSARSQKQRDPHKVGDRSEEEAPAAADDDQTLRDVPGTLDKTDIGAERAKSGSENRSKTETKPTHHEGRPDKLDLAAQQTGGAKGEDHTSSRRRPQSTPTRARKISWGTPVHSPVDLSEDEETSESKTRCRSLSSIETLANSLTELEKVVEASKSRRRSSSFSSGIPSFSMPHYTFAASAHRRHRRASYENLISSPAELQRAMLLTKPRHRRASCQNLSLSFNIGNVPVTDDDGRSSVVQFQPPVSPLNSLNPDPSEERVQTHWDRELDKLLQKNLVIQKRCESPGPVVVASSDDTSRSRECKDDFPSLKDDFPSLKSEAPESPSKRFRARMDMIMNAAKSGRSRVLTRLLTPNPNESTHGESAEFFREIVDVPDPLGFTPLMKSAHGGHTACLRVLLRHKADPNLVAKDNSTALHLAAQQGFGSAVEMLLEHGADHNPIAHLKKLIALGGNAVKDSPSALYLASQEGCADCVSILLNHAMSMSKKSCDSESPTDVPEIVTGSDLFPELENIDNLGCASSLYVASNNGHIKTVKQLLTVVDAGMLQYKSPETGRTCIEASEYNGHKFITKVLANAFDKHVHADSKSTAKGKARRKARIRKGHSFPMASSSKAKPARFLSFTLRVDTSARFKLGRGIDVNDAQSSKGANRMQLLTSPVNVPQTVAKASSRRISLRKKRKSKTKDRERAKSASASTGPDRVGHIVLLISTALKAALRNSEENHGHGTKWLKTILPQLQKLKTEHPAFTIKANTNILYHALQQTPEENRLSGEIWANKQGTQKWTGKSKTELLKAVVAELE